MTVSEKPPTTTRHASITAGGSVFASGGGTIMQPDSWPFLVGLFAVLTAAAFVFDYMYRALQRWVRPAFLARGDAEPNAARPVGPATPPLAAGPAGRCCHQWHTASVLYRQGGRMVCPTHYAGSPHQG